MIKVVDPETVLNNRNWRRHSYKETINEFLASGAEAAEIILPGVDPLTLYTGVRNIIEYYHIREVRITRHYEHIYLLRLHEKRTADAGTSDGPNRRDLSNAL